MQMLLVSYERVRSKACPAARVLHNKACPAARVLHSKAGPAARALHSKATLFGRGAPVACVSHALQHFFAHAVVSTKISMLLLNEDESHT